MEEMNNSIVNFITPDISTNSSTASLGLLKAAEIGMYGFSFLFGVPAHSYVIWLIITGTGSGIASEFFNLNLSVCEIGNCLLCLVGVLSTWFPSLLALLQFLQGLALTGRPLFHCLICVERYLAVVHPVTFLKFKPLRYRVICSTAVWIISFGSCFCFMFLLVSFSFVAYNCFFSIQFLLFLSVQLFCLLTVLRVLKQSGPGERGREREENHMKRRAFNIILITSVTMVITYAPFTIAGFLNVLTQLNTQGLLFTGFICFVLAGSVPFVLYLHRVGKLSCLC